MTDQPRTLDDVILCVCDTAAASEGKVSLGEIRDAIGGRAYGPLLFMACKQVWLPRWLLGLKVPGASLEKGARSARRPAQTLDRMLRPRITGMTEGVGRRGVALACITVGLLTPPLELIPFSTALSGGIIAVFGLGLTARDGWVVLLALAAGGISLSLVAWALLR